MNSKEQCTICKRWTENWTSFHGEELNATFCPNCLMWAEDQRAKYARAWLNKAKAARERAGMDVAWGAQEEKKKK